MAASAFVVEIPVLSGQTINEGVRKVVVWAFDAADAEEIAADYRSGDVNATWATDAVATPVVAPADLEGWRFNIVIEDADGVEQFNVSYTGVASDTIDLVGDALVIALNATGIDGAAYNSGTNVLTIAETTDAIGDLQVQVFVYPPAADVGHNVNHTYFFTSLVDGGMADAALAVTLVAASPSKVYAVGKA